MTEPSNLPSATLPLETKLRRPAVPPQHVARPRLLEQLHASAGRKLILVSAPAGYGKTSLVSWWLEQANGPCAWFSVDEHDDDLAAFLRYLVAAIRTVYPDALGASQLLLQAPTLLAPHRLADALLQDLVALPGPLTLAFDDYHTVNAPDIHALMTRLVEHLPAHVHLVLITRADPPLPLVRLRSRQQLGEIRAADLRFSAAEIELLLQQLLGSHITAETAALLEESTEGWAVGLHLAALSLRSQADPAAVARKLAQHGNQTITEYLLSEVLTGLPAAQRDCLLQSALFARFCAPLLDAVRAEDERTLSGADFLQAVGRANLFVVALDDESAWFRYHHLFQALLRVRLSQLLTAAQIQAIHARASAWFAGQGLVDEAVVHALKAGDPERAADLVEAHLHAALDREDWRQIEHLLALVPEAASRRPPLLLAQGWLHFIRWQFGAVDARLAAVERLLLEEPAPTQTGTPASATLLRGELNALRAAVAYHRGGSEAVVQLAQAALAALRPDMQYVMGMAQMYYVWGLQASGHYDRAVDFAQRQLDAWDWQANGLTLRLFLALSAIHFEMANLPALQSIVTLWRKLADQSGYGLSIAWSLYATGWLCYQGNDLARAHEYFLRVTARAWAAHGRAVIDAYTGLVRIALARGCPDDALTLIAALQDHLLERGLPALGGVVQSLEQRVALATGATPAVAWRQSPGATPATGDFWEQPDLTAVRTLLAAARVSSSAPDLAQATALLAESRATACVRNSHRRLIEIDALQALVSAAQGDEAAALAALHAAVTRAAPGGTLRLLVDCGPELVPLLQQLAATGLAPAYLPRLLAAFAQPAMPLPEPATQPPTAVPAARPAAPAAAFTNRELDVLVLLAQRLGDKEIAAQLVLSPLTIKKHTQRLYRKLGVDNRRAAVIEARRLGLI